MTGLGRALVEGAGEDHGHQGGGGSLLNFGQFPQYSHAADGAVFQVLPELRLEVVAPGAESDRARCYPRPAAGTR